VDIVTNSLSGGSDRSVVRNPRLALACLVVVAAFFPLPTTLVRAATSSPYAGHWHVTLYQSCVNTRRNRQVCTRLFQTPFRAFGVNGTSLTVQGPADYTVDSSGHFTSHFREVVTESAPGHRPITTCKGLKVVPTLWTGSCIFTGSDSGHIARGATGLPDFWVDHATSKLDTEIPVVPATFDTAQLLALIHLRALPGVTARMSVHRS
jgi:hypothetical protein